MTQVANCYGCGDCPYCRGELPMFSEKVTLEDLDREINLLKNQISLIGEPWCYEGGGQAQMGACPTHGGDSCLRTPEGLVEMILNHYKVFEYYGIEPFAHVDIPDPYDPTFGDDKICSCGHPYHRHFDSYEDMRAVGCKYCACWKFQDSDNPFPDENS